LADRAAAYDRDAKFPTENYKDLHRAGLLGISIPKNTAASAPATRPCTRGRRDRPLLRRDRADLEHACLLDVVVGPRSPTISIWTPTCVPSTSSGAPFITSASSKTGAIYSQPFSEGGAAAAAVFAFGTEAKPVKGGWIVNGKKIFASLSGHADYYGALCTEIADGEKASRRNTLYLALPAKAEGVSVVGRLGSTRHARDGVAYLAVQGCVRRGRCGTDAARRLFPRRRNAGPHMFLTLSPTYMGLAQAAYDFTVRYLRGEGARHAAGEAQEMYPTKQIAFARCRSSSSSSRRSGSRP